MIFLMALKSLKFFSYTENGVTALMKVIDERYFQLRHNFQLCILYKGLELSEQQRTSKIPHEL